MKDIKELKKAYEILQTELNNIKECL